MSLQYAAHVDHPISHHSENVQLTVAAIGILATVTIIATGGTAGLVVIASTATGLGIDAAAVADKAMPMESDAGQIATGFEKVLLGNAIKPAARANSDDSKSKICHVAKMFEGSKIVMLGPSLRPMTRRGDRVAEPCGGTVADGVHTILVGGNPSREGEPLDEGDSDLLKEVKLLNDVIGGSATIVKGSVVQGMTQLGAAGLSAAGQEDASNLAKVMSIRNPENALDAVDSANTAVKGIGSAVKIISVPGEH
jgi:uncharacterized Zn-binding protein involved in type VI secretion